MDHPVRIFISYSHRDTKLKGEMVSHLSLLEHSSQATVWSDGRIEPGDRWENTVVQELDMAELILLVITRNFLASSFCYGVEMVKALDRERAGTARVIPIIFRPCDWAAAPFGKLQAMPKDAKPVVSWRLRDEAYEDVAKGIRQIVELVTARRGGHTLKSPQRSVANGSNQDTTVADTKVYLERVDTSSAIPTLVVLPFADLSESRVISYLGVGITRAVARLLAARPEFRVLGRAVESEVAKTFETSTLEDEMQADVILDGTLRFCEPALEVSVRVRRMGESNAVSKAYNLEIRSATDLFDLYYDLYTFALRSIVPDAFAPPSTEVRRSRNAVTNWQAYKLYLQGSYFFHKRTAAELIKALKCFQAAVAIEPAYVPALSGIAQCFAAFAFYGATLPSEALSQAMAAATDALKIDPGFPEVRATMGLLIALYGRQWEAAEEHFQAAISADPTDGFLRWRHALDCLTPTGRVTEAMMWAESALALDPISPIVNAVLAFIAYFARRYDVALQRYNEALAWDPQFYLGHFGLGFTCASLRQFDAATQSFELAYELAPSAMTLAGCGYILGIKGDIRGAQDVLDRLLRQSGESYVSAFWIALVYIGLGRVETALVNLQKALGEPCGWLAYVKVWPAMDPLRNHRDFTQLMERLKLIHADLLRNLYRWPNLEA